MPFKGKHASTDKDWLDNDTDLQTQSSNKQSRSVNDLISRSRSDRVAKSGASTARVAGSYAWSSDSGLTASNPLIGDDSVHPAQLARQLAQVKLEASRRVSGPTPPPSWNQSKKSAATPSPPYIPTSAPKRSPTELFLIRELWTVHVLHAAAVHPLQARGVSSLLEITMLAVLNWMTENGRDEGDEEIQVAILWLDLAMRGRLMLVAAKHGRGWSLSELRTVCARQEGQLIESDINDEASSDDDWDTHDDSSSLETFTLLDLTGSRQAHRLLQGTINSPSLALEPSRLISLNLSCTTLDLSALVPLLPVSLRHLALADVTFLDKVTERSWRMLGQRLQTLTFLDLSYTPLPSLSLSFLLNPPATKLPSLRQLGIRGWSAQALSANRAIITPEDKLDPALKAIIRAPDRKRWIEILGDGPA